MLFHVAANEIHILLGQVLNDFNRLVRRQQRYDRPITKEAQIAVIGHDVDGTIPRCLESGHSARTGIVHRGDIYPSEANSRV